MVRPTESMERKDDAVTGVLFLSSINTWHNDGGIKMEVANIGSYFPNKNNPDQMSFPVKFNILTDMPKCRARKIGDDGKVVKKYDEITDKEEAVIEIIKNPTEVTIFYKGKKDATSDELECRNLSNLYPLLKFAFEQGGMDMSNFPDGFWFGRDELEEYLDGLTFIGKVEQREMSGNKYFVLIPHDIE